MTGGGDPFRQVQPGETLAIPAAAWNPLMKLARQNNTPEINTARNSQAGLVEISIRNDSGAALARYGVLAISGPLISPTLNSGAFLGRVAMTGVAVIESNSSDFVIALEPIGVGKIGRAVMRGTVPGKVKVVSTLHRFARAVAGLPYLESASSGPVRLLWVESAVGVDKHAIVDIERGDVPMMAIITGSVESSPNRWQYSWDEIDISDGDFVAAAGGKTSGVYGVAHNLNEVTNDATGVQGNGVDLVNLPIGFAIQPIGIGAVVYLRGPHKYTDSSNHWFFSDVNTVDGACP